MMSIVQTRSSAFDAIAKQYDELFTNSLIGRAQRDVVWEIVKRHIRPGSSVLELNCGTGEDAIFLSKCGMNVVACDISEKMIEVAGSRASREGGTGKLEFRTLAIEDLATFAMHKRFDAVFSNFSGLNCISDLHKTAVDLAELLPAESRAILCFSNKYCLWEVAWYSLQAWPAKAFRRWSSQPIAACIGNSKVSVRYPTIREIIAAFSPHFRLMNLYGIGVTVPPSYLEPWIRRLPTALALFRGVDRLVKSWPLMRTMGDHVVLVMERTTS